MITMTEKEATELHITFIKSIAGTFILGIIAGLLLAQAYA